MATLFTLICFAVDVFLLFIFLRFELSPFCFSVAAVAFQNVLELPENESEPGKENAIESQWSENYNENTNHIYAICNIDLGP